MGRICWRGRWKSGGVMDDESGDDERWVDKWMSRWIETRLVRLTEWILKLISQTRYTSVRPYCQSSAVFASPLSQHVRSYRLFSIAGSMVFFLTTSASDAKHWYCLSRSAVNYLTVRSHRRRFVPDFKIEKVATKSPQNPSSSWQS